MWKIHFFTLKFLSEYTTVYYAIRFVIRRIKAKNVCLVSFEKTSTLFLIINIKNTINEISKNIFR